MEQEKLSRKEREYLRHRYDILQTALKLFSDRGFHNVSMHEIAKEAEFAVGTLYNFFSNKEGLYKAIMLELADKFHSALVAALEGPGGEIAKIRSLIKAKVSVFMDNLDFVRLYLAEARGSAFNVKAGLEKDIKERYEETLKKMEKVFKEGIKKKLFADFNPYFLAVALDGISNAFLFEYIEHPEKQKVDADLILNIFLQQVSLNGAGEKEDA